MRKVSYSNNVYRCQINAYSKNFDCRNPAVWLMMGKAPNQIKASQISCLKRQMITMRRKSLTGSVITSFRKIRYKSAGSRRVKTRQGRQEFPHDQQHVCTNISRYQSTRAYTQRITRFNHRTVGWCFFFLFLYARAKRSCCYPEVRVYRRDY